MNEAIFYFFYNFAHQAVWLDKAIIFTAVYFPYLVIFFAFAYILFHRGTASNPLFLVLKKFKELILVFGTAGVAWVIARVLKILISASRPFDALPGVTFLFTQTGHAFPSGHATFFSALAFAIFFINKTAGYVFMLFALLIGLARIMAGVHFPIDILGGFALGAVVAYFVKKI